MNDIKEQYLSGEITTDADETKDVFDAWEEQKHPRNHGKFAKKGEAAGVNAHVPSSEVYKPGDEFKWKGKDCVFEQYVGYNGTTPEKVLEGSTVMFHTKAEPHVALTANHGQLPNKGGGENGGDAKVEVGTIIKPADGKNAVIYKIEKGVAYFHGVDGGLPKGNMNVELAKGKIVSSAKGGGNPFAGMAKSLSDDQLTNLLSEKGRANIEKYGFGGANQKAIMAALEAEMERRVQKEADENSKLQMKHGAFKVGDEVLFAGHDSRSNPKSGKVLKVTEENGKKFYTVDFGGQRSYLPAKDLVRKSAGLKDDGTLKLSDIDVSSLKEGEITAFAPEGVNVDQDVRKKMVAAVMAKHPGKKFTFSKVKNGDIEGVKAVEIKGGGAITSLGNFKDAKKQN